MGRWQQLKGKKKSRASLFGQMARGPTKEMLHVRHIHGYQVDSASVLISYVAPSTVCIHGRGLIVVKSLKKKRKKRIVPPGDRG